MVRHMVLWQAVAADGRVLDCCLGVDAAGAARVLGERMRAGDLARWREDGVQMYCPVTRALVVLAPASGSPGGGA